MKTCSSTARAAMAAMALGLAACATSQAAVLQQIAPNAVTYLETPDPGAVFDVMSYSGIGDVTALVQAVDLQLGLGNTSTSGCEAADFAGFAAGRIALVQRGTCTFAQKALNALAAGALGVLIFNQGNTVDPTRQDVVQGTLGATFPPGGMPVFGLTYALGVEFANTPGLTVRMFATAEDVAEDVAEVPLPASLPLVALGLFMLGATAARRPG